MKKKFQLLLPLLTLPLLTSCPPSLGAGPRFAVDNVEYSEAIEFDLADGFDIEVRYGLFDLKTQTATESDNDRTFMFLTGDSYDADEWRPIYKIEERYGRCYWKEDRFTSETIYNQKATIHLGGDLFKKERGGFYLILAEIYSPDTDAQAFGKNDVSFGPDRANQWFSYSVYEDSRVRITTGTWLLSQDSLQESSSSSEASENLPYGTVLFW